VQFYQILENTHPEAKLDLEFSNPLELLIAVILAARRATIGMRQLNGVRIEKSILVIRGLKVGLDSDLAELYDVPTRRLNEQVRRNIRRFPADFMFQLTADEAKSSRSQIRVCGQGKGGAPRKSLNCHFDVSRILET
jgi:hypothetical protein